MGSTEENKKINIRLYPIYKALSWDLLFFYAISFLFLTQIKGISAADVLLAEACYPIFKVILLMPLTMLIEKIGKRKSLMIANVINAISVLFFMIASNVVYVIIAQLFSAIAFNIKGIAETNLLYDSLPKDEKRGSRFSKMDGKGGAWYFYLDGITSALAGFLYVINGYIPLILAFITCLISAIISYRFKDIEEKVDKQLSFKKYMKDLKSSFQYMFKSNRLKYLLVLGALLTGVMGALVSLRSGVLEQIGVPEQYFGIIFAVLGIISGIASRNQNRIHNRCRNKTLAMLALPTTVSCILIGLTVKLALPYEFTVVVILLCYFIQFLTKGPAPTLVRRYLNNFTTSSLRNKITSCYNLLESLFRAGISLFASFLLRSIDTAGTTCIIGCILTIIVVLLLDKMRKKVGLKPEEYKKSEIEFLEIK